MLGNIVLAGGGGAVRGLGGMLLRKLWETEGEVEAWEKGKAGGSKDPNEKTSSSGGSGRSGGSGGGDPLAPPVVSSQGGRLDHLLPASERSRARVHIRADHTIHPAHVGWKGGSIVAVAESMNDLWISGDEWESQGVRVLRERLPLVW